MPDATRYDLALLARMHAVRPSRRQFLGRGAVAAAALAVGPTLLAACGDDDDDTASDDNGNGGTGTLRISNWPFYIAPGMNEEFEAQTGISVVYTEDLNDNEEYFAKIQEPLSRGQDVGADLFIPSDFLVARLIQLEWLAEIDPANVPNRQFLRDNVLGVEFDIDRSQSLPYLSGMVGLAYNRATVGREITSMDDLFDPQFAGQVSMLSDLRDGLGMVIQAEGGDLTTVTDDDVERGVERVEQARSAGQIRRFTGNDYGDDLANGNVVIAQAYSGDVAQLQLDNPDLEFVVPMSGGGLFSDNMVIPTTTANQAGAEAWMNFVLDPEVHAELVVEVQFVPVIDGPEFDAAIEALDPEVAENELINPPQEVLDRCQVWRPLTDEEDEAYSEMYARVTGA
jgi:spermidine/putrescine transport system substrate-binding protein